MNPRRFRVTDSSLRDGSHAMAHRFSPAEVHAVASGLDSVGVPVIEVSHGDGLGGSSFNYGFSSHDERELISAAVEAVKQAKIAVLLIPGIGVADDLRIVRDMGVQVARIATHSTEADISEQHMSMAKKLGMEAVGFLMLAHMTSPSDLQKQALLMESYGADCVYVVDSAGAMTVQDARVKVAALREVLKCEVGFHGHNNLSLAIANSLAALEAGATQIDGCTCGLGAGAGNCPTEILVAVCDKLGIESGIDTFSIMDIAEEIVRPIMRRPQVVDRANLLLGYAGVYSSFLLHTERAAARFKVDPKKILVELGRLKVVGGQEDMIVDIAAELARSARPAAAEGIEPT